MACASDIVEFVLFGSDARLIAPLLPVDDLITLTWTCHAGRSLFDFTDVTAKVHSQREAAAYDSARVARAVVRMHHAKDYECGIETAARRGCAIYARFVAGLRDSSGHAKVHCSHKRLLLACLYRNFDVAQAVAPLASRERLAESRELAVGVRVSGRADLAREWNLLEVPDEIIQCVVKSDFTKCAGTGWQLAVADFACSTWTEGTAISTYGYMLISSRSMFAEFGHCEQLWQLGILANARRSKVAGYRVGELSMKDTVKYLCKKRNDKGVAMLRRCGAQFTNDEILMIGITAAKCAEFRVETALGRRPTVVVPLAYKNPPRIPPIGCYVPYAQSGRCRICDRTIRPWHIMCRKCRPYFVVFAFWADADGSAVVCPVAPGALIPENCGTSAVDSRSCHGMPIRVDGDRFRAGTFAAGEVLYYVKIDAHRLTTVTAAR